MEICEYVNQHRFWSVRTFGTGMRTNGLIKHIKKELDEIAEDPSDLREWVDVIILGFDGAWRAGYTPEQISEELVRKQEENALRDWPSGMSEDEPIEHLRESGGNS